MRYRATERSGQERSITLEAGNYEEAAEKAAKNFGHKRAWAMRTTGEPKMPGIFQAYCRVSDYYPGLTGDTSSGPNILIVEV